MRIFFGNDAQREHPGQLAHRIAYGVLQIPVVILFDQVRDHFGIGFGAETMAFLLQLMLQRQIILDDPVMHYHDVAVAIAMRMRVLFRRPSVCRPTRVANSIRALNRTQPQRVFQIPQLSLRAAHRSVPSSSSTAIPAESYPRYSSRFKPSMIIGTALRGPM